MTQRNASLFANIFNNIAICGLGQKLERGGLVLLADLEAYAKRGLQEVIDVLPNEDTLDAG